MSVKKPGRAYYHPRCSFCGAEHTSFMREETYQRWKKYHGECMIRCPTCKSEKLRPERAEGEVVVHHLGEALGWDCLHVRKATDEEIVSVARARAIRDAGIQQMREEQAKWN